MIKQEIQRALQSQKVTSTSQLILFIVDQINKITYQDPIQQLKMRIDQLQKPKGLDNIMLQEVKTIVQAMLDHRQQSILSDVQILVDDKINNINQIMQDKFRQLLNEYITEKEQVQLKKQHTALRQLNSMQFINTDSLSLDNFYKPRTISQQLYSKNNFNSTTALTSKTLSNRNSFKKINNQSPYQQNQNLHSTKQLSDSKTLRHFNNAYQSTQTLFETNKLKENLNIQSKQIQDIKHTIIQLQRSTTDKLNLQEIHQIMSQFQTQIYQNIQNDKIHFQNLQFTLKKQLQSQILNFKKQTFNQLNSQQQLQKSIDQINKEINSLKKSDQKKTLKYQKLKTSFKQLAQNQKSLNSTQILIQKNLKSLKVDFQKYEQLNTSKNEDLAILLQQIHEKIQYLDKVDQIQHTVKLINSKIAISQFQTQFKTKNDQLVWQKQVYNFDPMIFKFQTQKSQIIIHDKGIYQVQFILVKSKTIQEFTGSLQIVPASLNFGKKELKVLSNQNQLKFIVQIEQKSLISLKISSYQNITMPSRDQKGLIKISRF